MIKNEFALYFGIASLKCKHFSIWSQFWSLGNEWNYRRWLWYCSPSTLNFLLDNMWDTEKKYSILYLLLSSGRWPRSIKAVLLHVLCSEKKNCWVKAGWDLLVNCFLEMDLDWREPRFHCQGCFGRQPCSGCSSTRSPPCLDQGLLGKDAWEQP